MIRWILWMADAIVVFLVLRVARAVLIVLGLMMLFKVCCVSVHVCCVVLS